MCTPWQIAKIGFLASRKCLDALVGTNIFRTATAGVNVSEVTVARHRSDVLRSRAATSGSCRRLARLVIGAVRSEAAGEQRLLSGEGGCRRAVLGFRRIHGWTRPMSRGSEARPIDAREQLPDLNVVAGLHKAADESAACRAPSGTTTACRCLTKWVYNLSRLSVCWLRLGIAIERIKPGRPHENGRHERMHLQARGYPAERHKQLAAGQVRRFISEFNEERPRDTLTMSRPAELYTSSSRAYRGFPELSYSSRQGHSRHRLRRICMHRKRATSQPSWPARSSASRRVTMAFGSSPSCTTISDIDLEQSTLQTIDNPLVREVRRAILQQFRWSNSSKVSSGFASGMRGTNS